jgi:hypothetical protein
LGHRLMLASLSTWSCTSEGKLTTSMYPPRRPHSPTKPCSGVCSRRGCATCSGVS